MDHIQAMCIFYVEVGTHNRLEQRKICILTITKLGIAMLTIHHYTMLASVSCKIPGNVWDKHHQTSSPLKNVLFISHNHEISAVVHCDLSVLTNTKHRTDLVHSAGWLETPATGTYMQQDSSCVERASWLLRIPFWLAANYIFLRTSHLLSLSCSSGLPTSFHYHHLLTSIAANHGSTNTSAKWEWKRIEQNDGHFIQYATHWYPTIMQTPLSSPWCCKCGHQKYDPGLTVQHCP